MAPTVDEEIDANMERVDKMPLKALAGMKDNSKKKAS